jgi:hypothetical protein
MKYYNIIKLYAMQSRRTGRYFRFVQYFDDGHGKYEDTAIWVGGNNYYDDEDIPTLVKHFPDSIDFHNHERSEVQLVPVEIRV